MDLGRTLTKNEDRGAHVILGPSVFTTLYEYDPVRTKAAALYHLTTRRPIGSMALICTDISHDMSPLVETGTQENHVTCPRLSRREHLGVPVSRDGSM
jgi:hypothetical protein